MRPAAKIAVVLALAFFLLDSRECFGQSTTQTIEVTSTWSGLGASSSEIVIRQQGADFWAAARRLDRKTVQSLLTSIENARPQAYGLEGLGITAGWLAENAGRALRRYLPEDQYKRSPQKQKKLFTSTFANYPAVDTMIVFNGVRLDDEPEITVRIVRSDGAGYKLRSIGNTDFLASWMIEGPWGAYETCDATISRELGRLLPAKFTNRWRLSEDALLYMVADRVMNGILNQWEAAGAQGRLGQAIEPITDRFELLSSELSVLTSIDISGGLGWHAVLHDSSMPSNLRVGLSLPVRNDKLADSDVFLRKFDAYVRLALSPSWFSQFLKDHPMTTAEVRFVEDRSLSRYAQTLLTQDLAEGGKEGIARVIAASAGKAVFVEVTSPPISGAVYSSPETSRWIVLPNRQMVLWRYEGETVANWSDGDLDIFDCNGSKCVGAMISEDGRLLSPTPPNPR